MRMASMACAPPNRTQAIVFLACNNQGGTGRDAVYEFPFDPPEFIYVVETVSARGCRVAEKNSLKFLGEDGFQQRTVSNG